MGFFGIGIFWVFLGFFGIFWDFLGFLNFQIGIGFFWVFLGLGFFGFLGFLSIFLIYVLCLYFDGLRIQHNGLRCNKTDMNVNT